MRCGVSITARTLVYSCKGCDVQSHSGYSENTHFESRALPERTAKTYLARRRSGRVGDSDTEAGTRCGLNGDVWGPLQT